MSLKDYEKILSQNFDNIAKDRPGRELEAKIRDLTDQEMPRIRLIDEKCDIILKVRLGNEVEKTREDRRKKTVADILAKHEQPKQEFKPSWAQSAKRGATEEQIEAAERTGFRQTEADDKLMTDQIVREVIEQRNRMYEEAIKEIYEAREVAKAKEESASKDITHSQAKEPREDGGRGME